MSGSAMPYFVYILECSDGTYYTGNTNNLKKRLEAHNCGRGARYTRARRPVRLAWFGECATRREAMRRERQVKRLPACEKIKLAHHHCKKTG